MIKHATQAALVGLALAAASFGSTAATRVFSNTTGFGIADAAPATLYPSPINVSGLGGTVSNVKVTLNGISHTWIGDLNILLVSPAGQKISLLQRYGMPTAVCCGFSNNFVNSQISFSANATSMIPTASANIPNGTYLPSFSGYSEASPFPAPAGPYSTNMATLNGPGASRNGTWQLFVSDHAGGDLGNITGGWTLTIDGFFGCAAEGYSGTKRTLCHQVCEINYPPTTLNALIRAWVMLYHEDPPCI